MSITRASRINHESSPRLAVAQLLNRFPQIPKSARVLIAGLAFKGTPETDDIRGSLAFPLMEELSKNLPEMELWTYDPLVEASKLPTELSKNHLLDLGAIGGEIDLLIIQHNGKRLLEALLAHPDYFKNSFVLDFWGDFRSELRPHTPRQRVYVFGGEKND